MIRIGLLALLVIASPASGQDDYGLQQKVNALSQQIELRYADNAWAVQVHRAVLAEVLDQWNLVVQSGDEAANRSLLNEWLQTSIYSTLPGGPGRLPEPPRFERTAREALPQATVGSSPTNEPVDSVSAPGMSASESAEQAVLPGSARQEVAKPVVRESQPTAAERKRSKWSRHPSAAPLEWSDPFEDDESASANPLRGGAMQREALRPQFEDDEAIRVDREELAARLRGYNDALGQLQTMLRQSSDLDTFELTDAADELESLYEERAFLDLYREGLSFEERRSMPLSPSAEITLELLRRQVRRLIDAASDSDSAEVRALDRLGNRLEELK